MRSGVTTRLGSTADNVTLTKPSNKPQNRVRYALVLPYRHSAIHRSHHNSAKQGVPLHSRNTAFDGSLPYTSAALKLVVLGQIIGPWVLPFKRPYTYWLDTKWLTSQSFSPRAHTARL